MKNTLARVAAAAGASILEVRGGHARRRNPPPKVSPPSPTAALGPNLTISRLGMACLAHPAFRFTVVRCRSVRPPCGVCVSPGIVGDGVIAGRRWLSSYPVPSNPCLLGDWDAAAGRCVSAERRRRRLVTGELCDAVFSWHAGAAWVGGATPPCVDCGRRTGAYGNSTYVAEVGYVVRQEGACR